jgi:hypothetical protein
MRWIAVTSKRKIEIEAERHFDAEQQAWKRVKKGEELLYIIRVVPN